MPHFPKNLDELTCDRLNALLQLQYPEVRLRDFKVLEVLQCGDGLASTADRAILELDFEPGFDQGISSRVMLKTMLLSPHAPHVMYETEVNFYRLLRPSLTLETPRAYASEFDADSGQFGIIMDDLGLKNAVFPNALDTLSIEQMQGLLTTLASLHAAFWNSERFATDLEWVPTPFKGGMSQIFIDYGLDIIRDQVKQHVFKQDLIAPLGRSLDSMWKSLWQIQDMFTSQTQTLLHGDTHIANTYLLGGNQGGLLDWQLMVRGTWSHDVAYVMVTGLTVEQRQKHEKDLLAFYLDQLAQQGVQSVPSSSEAFALYRRSVVWGLVIGWLITPPANYGEAITRANIVKLVTAAMDLESFEGL